MLNQMEHGFLRLRFEDDGDGTGKLFAEARIGGFAGGSAAYFGIERLREFAGAIAEFPLPDRTRCSIAGGFFSKHRRGHLEQEHLSIEVYPVDRRGHIGVQVRMATELWPGTRTDSQKSAKLEIITTYEPIAKFSKDLVGLLSGSVKEATLEGELLG